MIAWNPKLLTGIKIIDDDHKTLVDRLNDLYDAMIAGKGKAILSGLLNDLVDYTVKHFGREEALMAKYGYADAANHIGQHKKFVADVLRFQDDLKSGKLMISVELLKFLRDWLYNHIMQTDKKLGQALQAAGA